MKVLWLAPHLNHYKSRLLNCLHMSGRVSLCVLKGVQAKNKGYANSENNNSFFVDSVSVEKKYFGRSIKVISKCLKLNNKNNYDWIMIPAEGKNILLILIFWALKPFHNARLFSYNHAVTGNKLHHRLISKIMYFLLDRVVFYTENEKEKALKMGLLTRSKSFFANNTYDNTEVAKYNKFCIKNNEIKLILFIGRLIPSKNISLLFKYYKELKKIIPDLKIVIIGDGPDSYVVKRESASDTDIEWVGALSSEKNISPLMARADLVFIPGLSGLSINHAFAYGKPYITCANTEHGPEAWYLKDGVNGLVLGAKDFKFDCNRLNELLQNTSLYAEFCRNAFATANTYSIDKWVQEMEICLTR